ncbi:MAG: 2-amino-4-hydroxy-6-hydroxymethyldihydropteridine diphosphokinase [Cytophagales bacterium]|nr:MAG: 2-amino-4-hydroxy-6-hydroxymethyldihydropteridine diphosphokinase [Cytophagales bacterium]
MIVLLLGSNVGDRAYYLTKALEELQQRVGKLLVASSVYATAPWGIQEQPIFLNQVLVLEGAPPPLKLLEITQAIEKDLAIPKTVRWGERMLDIDILYLDELIFQTEHLQIPHPQIAYRRFTLVPLCEILPNFLHPTLQKSHLELLTDCPDQLSVELIKPFEKNNLLSRMD